MKTSQPSALLISVASTINSVCYVAIAPVTSISLDKPAPVSLAFLSFLPYLTFFTIKVIALSIHTEILPLTTSVLFHQTALKTLSISIQQTPSSQSLSIRSNSPMPPGNPMFVPKLSAFLNVCSAIPGVLDLSISFATHYLPSSIAQIPPCSISPAFSPIKISVKKLSISVLMLRFFSSGSMNLVNGTRSKLTNLSLPYSIRSVLSRPTLLLETSLASHAPVLMSVKSWMKVKFL